MAGGEKRKRTRQKLIDAAAKVIGERGFERASLEAITAEAGMTRGAFYGNFSSKDELFLAMIAAYWAPIVPPLQPGASFAAQMRALGEALADEAKARRGQAAAATAFQLYLLTHESLRLQVVERNAQVYRHMAREITRLTPREQLPMDADVLVPVLDALITGLLFTYFQTPELIDHAVFMAAFEVFAAQPRDAEVG